MKSFLTTSSLLATAFAATIDVTVGPNLRYSPSSVTAAVGDVIAFQFTGGHSVVSGPFNSPCNPNNMIYSGVPSSGSVFYVPINNTDPIWIYCSIPGHCEAGMAMVINAP